MKKIISLFIRNYDGDRLVRDEIVCGAEWVMKGEGVATQKLDGTCCMIKDGILYKRYSANANKIKPDGFILAEAVQQKDRYGKEVSKIYGWVPVGDSKEDKWHREAFIGELEDGTYELVGPKINGNPEKRTKHELCRHGEIVLPDAPRTFNELKEWFKDKDIEGIVWHSHGRKMVKIKKKDFGYKR